MSFAQVIPNLKRLARIDKLQTIQFFVLELAKEEEAESPFTLYGHLMIVMKLLRL